MITNEDGKKEDQVPAAESTPAQPEPATPAETGSSEPANGGPSAPPEMVKFTLKGEVEAAVDVAVGTTVKDAFAKALPGKEISNYNIRSGGKPLAQSKTVDADIEVGVTTKKSNG
jgi:hypothetical protein